MANRLLTMKELWWSCRQAVLDAKDMRGVLKQTAYDIRHDMTLHQYRCLRTNIAVAINGNQHKRKAADALARQMLLRGRFHVAIQRIREAQQ